MTSQTHRGPQFFQLRQEVAHLRLAILEPKVDVFSIVPHLLRQPWNRLPEFARLASPLIKNSGDHLSPRETVSV